MVSLPRLLAPVVGDERHVSVPGESIGAVIDGLLDRHPGLRVHLFDEVSNLRPHVLCFIDGTATRLEDRSLPISPTADVTFLQAVSGG